MLRDILIHVRRALKRVWVPITMRSWPIARAWYRVWGVALHGSPQDLVWYFAYGANLHDDVFLKRRKMRPIERRVGRILGYRLRFNLEGRPKGKAAPANISADDTSEVWGVLYLITGRDMVWLNATEGVPGWRYKPIWLEAVDQAGHRLRVFTYIADGFPDDAKPSKRYIKLLRDGARAHGLPPHWINHLDAVQPAE